MDTTLAEGKTAIADAGHAGRPFLMADGWKEGSTVSIRMFPPVRRSRSSVSGWVL